VALPELVKGAREYTIHVAPAAPYTPALENLEGGLITKPQHHKSRHWKPQKRKHQARTTAMLNGLQVRKLQSHWKAERRIYLSQTPAKLDGLQMRKLQCDWKAQKRIHVHLSHTTAKLNGI
jgi:hypothetical protein